MELYEKMLDSKLVFEGKVVRLSVDSVELPDGSVASREVIHHPGAVCVVAIQDGNLLMVEQYRYAYGKVLIELPAGKLEVGEVPELAAIRELEEEVGVRADSVELICTAAPTPAYCKESIWIYLAKDFKESKQNLDSGEFLNIKRLPFVDCIKMALDDEFEDAKTKLGILTAAGRLGMLSIKNI